MLKDTGLPPSSAAGGGRGILQRIEVHPALDDRRDQQHRHAALVIGLSVAAGLLCGYLPEEYQAACKLAAKVAAFFGGG